jgi:hypothetical protein
VVFFSSCEEDVQAALRESRAKVLIAKNERELLEEQAKKKRLESPEALLVSALRVMSLAGRCADKKGVSPIAGWAKTVADGYAESVARSAPSSVPSLESVSDSVEGTVKSMRLAAYERELKTLEEYYVSLEVCSAQEYDSAKGALQQRYEDVLLSDVEAALKQSQEVWANELRNSSLGMHERESILSKFGIVSFY